MDIVLRCRNTEAPERFRQHVGEKLAKLERFDSKVIRIDVELSHEPNPRLSERSERVELTCASRGPVVRAEAAAESLHAALDLAVGKLEARLRRAADRRRVHHGNRTPASVAAALAGPDTARTAPERPGPTAAVDAGPVTPRGAGASPGNLAKRLGVEGDGPLVVREKVHRSEPMSLDQALHEMELVGHDFYLFWDVDDDVPSVVYRRRGYDYGVLRLRRRNDE